MASRRPQSDGDTASQILDVAERLAQTRGFNGFSYADISAELGVTKAALHYHFASKADLGQALVARYTARFAEALAAADAELSGAPAKLDAYVGLYEGVLRGRRMCLCGMLAAEFQTLPRAMQDAVVGFLDGNEAWLQRVLLEGQREGTLQFTESATEVSRSIVSGLEGAMLVARTYDDIDRFRASAHRLLASLGLVPPEDAQKRARATQPPRRSADDAREKPGHQPGAAPSRSTGVNRALPGRV